MNIVLQAVLFGVGAKLSQLLNDQISGDYFNLTASQLISDNIGFDVVELLANISVGKCNDLIQYA
ncbi:hypothetical protein [Listeria grayi]|uniref:Uncharacterized protein n=1 Tax=Listeria grayi DSM 20601 TaxID=525367 RepID=D7V070_LISGR|nr:hypothetical protein [Listeria grayi]EFI83823.1 hypothetical protein HMPREF0556_12508 [Listeria grayi DSM 20601]